MKPLAPIAPALLLALGLTAPAKAATTTASIALSPSAYTDLGAGPLMLGAAGGDVIYQIADSIPAAGSLGLSTQPFLPPANLQTSAHVWARSGPGGASAIVTTGTGVPGAGVMGHANTASLGTSLVVKAAPGNLAAFNCAGITGGVAGFCVAYNATAAPSTGALTGSLVLDACYFDTTAKGCSLSHLPKSIAASLGITILVTSAASPLNYTTGTDTAYIEADAF